VSHTVTVGGDAGEAPGDDATYADLLRAVGRGPRDAAALGLVVGG
jgi:hypothetical protein